MSSERSISPDPLPRSHSRSSVANDEKESNGHRQASSSSNSQKRRRDNSNRTPSPRSATSRSRSRSSIEGSKSPPVNRANASSNRRSPSPVHHSSSSSSKRRRHKDGADSGKTVCELCHSDVESQKRLFGVLDNCDHVFCYECIVSWKRSKYSNAESESCPVCKVRSSFITPSKHWFENKDDKHRIIKKHRNHLKTLPCRYYLRHGFCRYSDRCFYDHHEAAKQYKQQNRRSRSRERERDRDRDHYGSRNDSRSRYHSPSPSRQSSSRYRDRAY